MENSPERSALRRKLQRARGGRHQAASRGQQPPRTRLTQPALDLPGDTIDTDYGPAYVIEAGYEYDHTHGNDTLGALLERSGAMAARLTQSRNPAEALDLSKLAFLDTETTGLFGAGTLAFLVGVGTFEADRFVLRQYFLRDPGEETAMLTLLADQLHQASGVVTFNGRGFDVPLLDTRYLMNRLDGLIYVGHLPNLDLLTPSRRLWRGRTENCRLGTLETSLLGLQRSEADIPGWEIPQVYQAFLQTGALHDIKRVLYHNVEDILSMVTLATRVLKHFEAPDDDHHEGQDALRVAMWFDDRAQHDEAEAAYQAALAQPLPDAQQQTALWRYAAYLKRRKRRAEACAHWEALAALTPDDPNPAIELAKHYEWEARDWDLALTWTAAAIAAAEREPLAWRRNTWLYELEQRRQRLLRKQARQ